MSPIETLEIHIDGMDCADCASHIKRAIKKLPGVSSVEVFLVSEKAIIDLDKSITPLGDIKNAVLGVGYEVRSDEPASRRFQIGNYAARVMTVLALVFGLVVFVAVIGEWFGLFQKVNDLIPLPLGALIVILLGSPIFLDVIRSTVRLQITAQTLMGIGAVSALFIGEWTTGLVVVLFMHVGGMVERFTTDRARHTLRDLTALQPKTANVIKQGTEVEIPLEELEPGDVVVVRPGESLPADGIVVDGSATVDQSQITGESMPVEIEPGDSLYSGVIIKFGSIRVKVEKVGIESTFGKIIKLVEEAEGNRADLQKLADRFSTYFLPVVLLIAGLTYLIGRNPIASVAVLVVACSCGFALATPVAVLASVGAAAKRGLLIKGGKYLEVLAGTNFLLIDKTGTLTLGKPQVAEVIIDRDSFTRIPGLDGFQNHHDVLKKFISIVTTAEKYSEHPLADAVRDIAEKLKLDFSNPEDFKALPGVGVRANVGGNLIEISSTSDLISETQEVNLIVWDTLRDPAIIHRNLSDHLVEIEALGRTMIHIHINGKYAGTITATDTLRMDVPEAIRKLRSMGIKNIELLTGDNRQMAEKIADQLEVDFQASLLPEDKIEIIRQYQAEGKRVVMIGDGVNDAPALVQADVGIAMGAVGSDIAVESADIVLLHDNWRAIPELFQIARRTLRVVKGNLVFTMLFNLVGITLSAIGILPPVLAAASQSLPDLGIMVNSSRLINYKNR